MFGNARAGYGGDDGDDIDDGYNVDEANSISGTISRKESTTEDCSPPFERRSSKTESDTCIGVGDDDDDNFDSNGNSNNRCSPPLSDFLTTKPPRIRRDCEAYRRLKFETPRTIKQCRNMMRSVDAEFSANLTGHLWSAVLIKRKQNEVEERLRRHSPDDSDEDPPPARKRRRGRPRQSGPDITSDKLVTKSWTAWPLPYRMLPPLHASTAVAPAASSTTSHTPHPLEEAITALFLRQSTASLRARNLPISADDTISAHALKPTAGGILEKLDKLLLAVYECRHAELRGGVDKIARGRVYRKVPMGWREVLELASLTRWDEGWGKQDGTFRVEAGPDSPSAVATRFGPVSRATQRMCTEFKQAMTWRVRSEESHLAGNSTSLSLPIEFRASGAAVIREPLEAVRSSTSPAIATLTNSFTSLPSGNTRLHLGVHNDGFLDFIPKTADREAQRQLRVKEGKAQKES